MPIELTKDGQQPKPTALYELYMEIIRDVTNDLREAGLIIDDTDTSPPRDCADSQADSVASQIKESIGEPES